MSRKTPITIRTPPKPTKFAWVKPIADKAIALVHFVFRIIGIACCTILMRVSLSSIIGREFGSNGACITLVFASMFLFGFVRAVMKEGGQ